jgi:16S rRNA (guanine(1405)-N(7))-methyltransferase
MTHEGSQDIVAELRRTAKYRDLCEDTLIRIASWAEARYPAPKEAIKAAKRKLHQIHGAYLDRGRLDRIRRLVESLPQETSEGALRDACLPILRCHASTRERIAILEDAFPKLLDRVRPLEVILDLACGLMPFALPWMALSPTARYVPVDIDRSLIELINLFFQHVGHPQTATCRDILVSPPNIQADAVFLLKTLPCLEQQDKGSALRLLRRLRTRYALISFPTQSLCGHRKGMPHHYDAFMDGLVAELGVPAERFPYPPEIFYVLQFRR